MRLAVLTLAGCLISPLALGAAINLEPDILPDIPLVYDTTLTNNNAFCAATPHDLYMTLSCTSGCGGGFTLEGSDGSTIPVSLLLSHDWHASPDIGLNPGQETGILPSQGNDCGNSRNIRKVKATVNANDVDVTKLPYERTINVGLRNSKGDIENNTFVIRIGAEEFIRISNLQDLVLQKGNASHWQVSNPNVCVFGTAAQYRLTATSSNNGQLVINSNGNKKIGYTLSLKEPGGAVWQPLTLGQSYPNLAASGDEYCMDGTVLGMRVSADASDVDKAKTGVYSDRVTLVVEAS